MTYFSRGAELLYQKRYKTVRRNVGHQGIEKTKASLRDKIWYPGMDGKVKTLVENCVAYQAVGPSNPPEPMRITPTATEPWQSLASDFYGPIPHSGQYLLVVTDTYSKFPARSKNCYVNFSEILHPEVRLHICNSWYTEKD